MKLRCEIERWKECVCTSQLRSLLTVSILYWADHLLSAYTTPSIKLQQMDTVKIPMTSSYALMCLSITANIPSTVHILKYAYVRLHSNPPPAPSTVPWRQ